MTKAYLLNKTEQNVSGEVVELPFGDLPPEKLEVAVLYSSFNYKDAMVVRGIGGLVKNYPHVPGIDLVGTVLNSTDDKFHPGDKIIATGWHLGERFWGGFSTRANINPEFAIALPSNISPRTAMALGTAGLSAMLAVMALEKNGLRSNHDLPVLVTGATGGVGSVATLLLSKLGYAVVASTGKTNEVKYLEALGAKEIIDRNELLEPSARPLEKQSWSAAIDSVGGATLSHVISRLALGGSVACVGLVGGTQFSSSIYPLLLRGVNILGIDSATVPNSTRILAWDRLASLDLAVPLEKISRIAGLDEISTLTETILAGKQKGRIIVDPNLG